MILQPDLDKVTGHNRHGERKIALCNMINEISPGIHDLRPPHELALFLSQVLHESQGLRYAKEVWGPTSAQRRYEGRRDLGNTQRGDGKRFMGRDVIQVTGRANYRSFTAWMRERQPGAPDFEARPELLERLQYLGWGALWYWATRIPSKYLASGDIEMVTRRVNGGLNGYPDRLRYYDRAALVLLGYEPDDVTGFQRAKGLVQDGISGPRTRATMHEVLSRPSQTFSLPPDVEPIDEPPKPPNAPWVALFAAIRKLFERIGT